MELKKLPIKSSVLNPAYYQNTYSYNIWNILSQKNANIQSYNDFYMISDNNGRTFHISKNEIYYNYKNVSARAPNNFIKKIHESLDTYLQFKDFFNNRQKTK